ncbi:hypothetical protein Tco_0884035, partial [Tanacetum coccineum]
GKENGLLILQSIDQGPFELGTTRNTLGTTPEGGVLLGLERPCTYEDLSDTEKKRYDADVRATNILINDMRNIRMTMPNIQLNSKFVNNMSPEWDRITPATNDQHAFVSTVQPHAQSSHVQSHQYPSLSTNHQSLQYLQFPETSQIDSGYTKTDEILDNLTKQMALLAQSFRDTLPQMNNQLRTSSNTQNQATIHDGRGNGAAGNRGAQNRARNANAGQGKLDKMLLMQAQENGAVLDEEELLFLANKCDAFDSDVDDEPTAQSIFMANYVTNLDEHEIHNEVQQANVIDSTSVDMGNSNVIPYEQYLSVDNISVVPSCASSALNDVCVSSDNYAFVPHDPIATELKIYKEQVSIYEQRAKFELTEREQ